MTSNRFLDLVPLLLLLLFFSFLHRVCGEESKPEFRAEGRNIELGYCFGADYIVAFRSAPGGDQLLGNSSADHTPVPLLPELQGRVNVHGDQQLLGLQISNLTRSDSGIYRRECFKNQTLVTQQTVQLTVCDEEVKAEEIVLKEEHGRIKIQCNSSFIGLEGTYVHWYQDANKLRLLLDSSVPLGPELQGLVQVRNNGAVILLDKSLFSNDQNFFCLVFKGKTCLNFQNLYTPDHSESRDIFASHGDRLVLNCPFDDSNQYWETSRGKINSSSVKNNDMFISFGEKDFSLVIPAVFDNHSGEYSCFSSLFEMHYNLVLCPKKQTQENVLEMPLEGEEISLHCDVGSDHAHMVQWHRRQPSGEDELIHDTHDKTAPVPQDLRGRLTVSEDSSSLTISHLQLRDLGLYWCVVSESSEFLDDGYEFTDDDDYSEDEIDDEDDHWYDTVKCVFKQETILRLNPEPRATAGQDNVIPYAVGAGVVVLLLAVVGVVVALILRRRRTEASQRQRKAASPSAQDMTTDPGCSDVLYQPDGNIA